MDLETPVRVCMSCAYCDFSAMHSGPAGEVADFLRALAIAHVTDHHPDKVPLGDIDLTVLGELGFH